MDHATIAAARLGDRAAQAALLNALQDSWFRFCLSLIGDPDQARDAVQETALRFLTHLPEFGARSQLKTWSFGIALNIVREMRRGRKHVPFPEGGTDTLSTTAGPDTIAGTSEESASVREVLRTLPDRQREAIVLRFFEELSVEQTAGLMQCAPGTVKATVHQALRAMRAKLTELA